MAIRIVGTDSQGRQIEVVIENGKSTIVTKGFAGRSCQDATAGLEAALGVKTSDTPTAEMHQTSVRPTISQS